MPPKRPGRSSNADSSKATTKRKRPAANASDSEAERTEIHEEMQAVKAKRDTVLPVALIHRIMHESMKDKSLRMTEEASVGFTRYIDLFLLEAIRRAAEEKDATFLEVEALETAAPQLLLDF